MSTEVSHAAVEELTDAVIRTFDVFPAEAWVDPASAVIKLNGKRAAAQLAPGETVEWITPGVMHRHGKVWPGAILMVTPYRTLIAASRGTIRPKTEVCALYRGPETLLEISSWRMPGDSSPLWTMELASEQGSFRFGFLDFNRAREVAELTGAFVTGRATFSPESGQILLDGAPVPVGGSAATGVDPFAAAQADLVGTGPADGGPATMPLQAVSDYPAFADLPAAPVIPAPREAPVDPEDEKNVSSAFADDIGVIIGDPLFDPAASFEPAPVFNPAPLFNPAPTFVPPPSGPDPFYETTVQAPVFAEPEPVVAAPVTLPAADWYDDPIGEAQLRYWDGTSWTKHTAS
jgi:hypothetical protein